MQRRQGGTGSGGALLKPDIEDPEPFFWIHPDTGKLEPHPSLDAAGRERALKSIELCDLQRPALCTQRVDKFNRVARWLNRLPNADQADLEEWEDLSDPRMQYKFVLRHLLRLHNLLSLEKIDRDRFASGR